jgi:recombination protein RecR
MKLPRPLQNLIDSFQQLPGIGPKTAERLTFYLLRVPQETLDQFSDAISNLKKTTICKICKNVGENEICAVCQDHRRDKGKICVVESPLDVIALEKSGFNGLYHVLHGAINPIAGISPEELFIEDLLLRLCESHKTYEIILATNPDMEGEATAMFIKEKLLAKSEELKEGLKTEIVITRIGRGLPTGGDLEYADETTIRRALEGRTVA